LVVEYSIELPNSQCDAGKGRKGCIAQVQTDVIAVTKNQTINLPNLQGELDAKRTEFQGLLKLLNIISLSYCPQFAPCYKG